MNRLRTGLLLSLLASMAVGQTLGPSPQTRPGSKELPKARLLNFDSPGRIPGEFAVVFRSDAELATLPALADASQQQVNPEMLPTTSAVAAELASALALNVSGRVTEMVGEPDGMGRRHFYMEIPEEIADKGIELLAGDPRIDFIEPVMRTELTGVQTSAPWHLDRIDQVQLPLNGTYSYPNTGYYPYIALLDTGVRYTHSEFQDPSRVLNTVQDCTGDSGSNCPHIGYLTYPYYPPDCGTGHGTGVASFLLGNTFGVAKGAHLKGIRIVRCNGVGTSQIMERGIRTAIGSRSLFGANIIQMSVLVNGVSTLVEQAVSDAIAAGMVFVTGAGPWGTAPAENACNNTPARMPAVITVGSTNSIDQVPNSNFGPCVDLYAPGVNVLGASMSSTTATQVWNGTSFAAPIVSGMVALYLTTVGNRTPQQVHDAIVQGATSGVLVGNIGVGSPNKLANSSFSAGSPPAGTLQLLSSAFAIAENAASAPINVTREGGSAGAASVSYATSNGTAGAGIDYTAVSGTLSWADGDATAKPINIPLLDDAIYEGDEFLYIALSNASGASLGAPTSATLTLSENENPPPGTIQLSTGTYSVNEGGPTVTVTATRTGGSFGAVGVSWSTANGTATAGNDYVSATGPLGWANGDTASQHFAVSIVDDGVEESSEAFSVSISGPTGGASLGIPTAATITIADNDSSALTVPGNLRPSGIVTGTAWTMLWNASTGPVAYYVLQRVRNGNTAESTINAPAVSHAQSGPNGSESDYQVKACTSGGQCSGWSNQASVTVCLNGQCP